MTAKPELKAPLTHQDIKYAINASGYPLEVELFHYLAKEGLDPILGFRTALVDGGPTKEIDLITHLGKHTVEDGLFASVAVRTYIGVRRLHAPSAFIGVVGAPPTPHEYRVTRTHFSTALPSAGYLAGLGDGGLMQLLHGGSRPNDWMDPLIEAPACVHWAVVERTKDGPWAGGDKQIWEDIDLVVRASHHMGREAAEYRVSQPHARSAFPSPDIRYDFVMLLLDTPSLYLYDPQTSALSECQWLALHRLFEVGSNQLASRVVDIVTKPGLAQYIAALKQVVPAISERLYPHLRTLQAGAAEQFRLWDQRTAAPE